MDNLNIHSAQYYSYDGVNVGINLTLVGDESTVIQVLNKPGNRYYDEIIRQVEAGTLTIADAE